MRSRVVNLLAVEVQHMSGEQSGEAQLRPRARLALLAVPTAGGHLRNCRVCKQKSYTTKGLCVNVNCSSRKKRRRWRGNYGQLRQGLYLQMQQQS